MAVHHLFIPGKTVTMNPGDRVIVGAYQGLNPKPPFNIVSDSSLLTPPEEWVMGGDVAFTANGLGRATVAAYAMNSDGSNGQFVGSGTINIVPYQQISGPARGQIGAVGLGAATVAQQTAALQSALTAANEAYEPFNYAWPDIEDYDGSGWAAISGSATINQRLTSKYNANMLAVLGRLCGVAAQSVDLAQAAGGNVAQVQALSNGCAASLQRLQAMAAKYTSITEAYQGGDGDTIYLEFPSNMIVSFAGNAGSAGTTSSERVQTTVPAWNTQANSSIWNVANQAANLAIAAGNAYQAPPPPPPGSAQAQANALLALTSAQLCSGSYVTLILSFQGAINSAGGSVSQTGIYDASTQAALAQYGSAPAACATASTGPGGKQSWQGGSGVGPGGKPIGPGGGNHMVNGIVRSPSGRPVMGAIARTPQLGLGYSSSSPPSKTAAFAWTAAGTFVGLFAGALGAMAVDKKGHHGTLGGWLVIGGAVLGGGATAAIVTPSQS